MSNNKIIVSLLLILFTIGCAEAPVQLPKPRIYPRVIYPEKSYTLTDQADCMFTMESPDYFLFIKDTSASSNEETNPCWFDMYCESLNAYLHFSYHPVKNGAYFEKLIQDAFEMADKHNIKADYRDELRIEYPEKDVHGLLFELGGPVATPIQFFLTDSTTHFLRGSLYFKDKINRDSIAPVYDFLKEDIARMIGTFEWR